MAGGGLSGAGATRECQVTGESAKSFLCPRIAERAHRPATSAGVMRLSASNFLLYGGQCFNRPAGDHFPLGLCDDSKNSDGQVIGIWNISSEKPSAAVPQSQQEGGVARKTIKLGDDQGRVSELGSGQRLSEHRAIITPPRLDLRELSQERQGPALCELLHRVPLCLQTQATSTL